MADRKTYKAPHFNPDQFAQQVANLYQSENYEVQVIKSANGVMIQSRAKEFLKKASVALTITATVQNDNVVIESGNTKWAMNAVSSVAALIVFWPLLGLTAYTSYKQKQLIDDSWQLIDRYMLSIGAVPTLAPIMASMAEPAPTSIQYDGVDDSDQTCPSCGKPGRRESKFCDHCGKPMATGCAKCGAVLRPDAKFCDHCGQAV